MSLNIPFHIPFLSGCEQVNISQVLSNASYQGGGTFSKRCEEKLQTVTHSPAFLTTSCTKALTLTALLINIQPGDEVIMPSFTYVSTANPFVLRGAKIVFTDINPETMNITAAHIEAAITDKTKAVVAVHYGGISCDMPEIKALCTSYNLFLIEDAAQAIDTWHKDKHAGTWGDFGCLSFHETKNIHCGEGGTLLINNASFLEKAYLMMDKGTNRRAFLRHETSFYNWQSPGLHTQPGEINAAFLSAQLDALPEVNAIRKQLSLCYHQYLDGRNIETSPDPKKNGSNNHLFFIKASDATHRKKIISYLKKNGIAAYFHYIPLHSSPAGRTYGRFQGKDLYTTTESERLLRLPLHTGLSEDDVAFVCEKLLEIY